MLNEEKIKQIFNAPYLGIHMESSLRRTSYLLL